MGLFRQPSPRPLPTDQLTGGGGGTANQLTTGGLPHSRHACAQQRPEGCPGRNAGNHWQGLVRPLLLKPIGKFLKHVHFVRTLCRLLP